MALPSYVAGYGQSSASGFLIERSSGVYPANCTGWSNANGEEGSCYAPRYTVATGTYMYTTASGKYKVFDIGSLRYTSNLDYVRTYFSTGSMSYQGVVPYTSYGLSYTGDPSITPATDDFGLSMFFCDTIENCTDTFWVNGENPAWENFASLSSSYDTQFTGVSNISFASSTNTLSFDVSQYIKLSELNSKVQNRNITMHYVWYQYGSSSQAFGSQGFSFSPVDGYSTTSISISEEYFSTNGTHTIKVNFGNIGSVINDVYAFPETYLYFDFIVEDGEITSTQIDSPYVYTPDVVDEGLGSVCSLRFSLIPFDVLGCSYAVIKYLFVPSTSLYSQMASVINASSTPSVSLFTTSFNYVKGTLDNLENGLSNASSSLDVSIAVPISNATMTIPVLSLASAYTKGKPAFDLFRLVTLSALFLYAVSAYIQIIQTGIMRLFKSVRR